MRNWSLNAKIVSILAIFFVACLVISGMGIAKLGTLNETMDYMISKASRRVILAADMRGAIRQMTVMEKNIIAEETREGMMKFAQEIEDAKSAFLKAHEEVLSIAREDRRESWRRVGEMFKDFADVNAKIQTFALANNDKEAFALSTGKNRENRVLIEKSLQDISDANRKEMEKGQQDAHASYESSRIYLFGISALAILLGCSLAFIVLRSLNASINRVIASLEDGASQVTSAAQQISASSEELSQAAAEQASSLEETASAVEEMSSMIQKNSDNAKRTAEVATSSQESAAKGKDVVQSMINAIQDINTSNNQISEIAKVISDIGAKTKVINDIVFQTKLLSFNASVEAARAGEHGKGFAVVAEEVGNLAQMSGNAAKEISSMLETSIENVERMVAMSREKVAVGTRVAGECGHVLDEIVVNVARVTTMADEIAKASEEQSRGIQEITRAMAQLDQVTQQNAASSEETASSAEELSGQAVSLRNVVSELIATIKGGHGQSPAMVHHQVAPMTSLAPKATAGGKVLTLKKTASQKRGKGSSPSALGHDDGAHGFAKKAAGSDVIPAESDPRFEEV